MRRSMLLLAALACLILVAPSLAEAGIVARINISSQRMNVYVDGMPRYTWLVSTARPRLSNAGRHLQADGYLPLSRLDHL